MVRRGSKDVTASLVETASECVLIELLQASSNFGSKPYVVLVKVSTTIEPNPNPSDSHVVFKFLSLAYVY